MNGASVERKLAAVLCADVVGYSRLMQDDDRATLAALTERRALFAERVAGRGGRIVNAPGDSILAEFASVVNAVECAVGIQRALAELNAGLPESRRMQFRIGVNLGDVLVDAAGIYGDGVNIAARLESLTPTGGISVSAPVHAQVKGRAGLEFEDAGEHSVKNIAEPVRVYRVVLDGKPSPSAAPPSAPAPTSAHPVDKASLAVLPFANLSGDAEQEYFADGIVDDIITALSRMQWFFVIARNSSFTYKGRAVDIKQVGRELGVRYVLEGSVRKAGNRVRITGQLIEAENGRHVWADRFEGTLDDIFDLQDRITESVVGAIEPSIRRAEIERAISKPTADMHAYDLCLRAMAHMLPGAADTVVAQGLAHLKRAIEVDPKYSLARALAAFACTQRVVQGSGGAEDIKEGLGFAATALADHRDSPTTLALSGLALGTLGYRAMGVTVLGFRYDEALHAVARALELSPNLFTVLFSAGMVRAWVGESDAAIEHFTRAMRLSPRDPGMGALIAGAGTAHMAAGRYEEALAAGKRATHESPNFLSGHRLVMMSLAFMGRIEEAKVVYERIRTLAPGFTVSRYRSVSPYRDKAHRERVAQTLLLIGVPE